MKMKVIWTPEARADAEWVVDRGNPSWDISYPVEKETGWGWLEFLERFDAMSPIAWRVLLWALRRRDETRLPIDSVIIDDWTELDLLVECPGCVEWVVPKGHECDFSAIEVEVSEDGEIAVVEAEPKKGGKQKAGEA